MFRTGWRPDLETWQAPPPSRAALPPLPASVSFVPYCPELLPQGAYNNCVAHALILAVETNKIKRGDYGPGNPFAYLSRLQHYYDQRDNTGTTGSDSGSSISNALLMMANRGAAPETMWDYTKPITQLPPPSVYTEAAKQMLTAYAPVGNGIVPIKQALAAGHPVLVGLFLRQSFFGAPGGVVPMPGANDPVVGNHVVCLTGYGEYPGYFSFANSWGTGWGQGGFGYLPESIIGNASFSASYWAVQNQSQ